MATEAEDFLRRKKYFPKIWSTSQLDFGFAMVGDRAKRVLPGKYESPENGSFLVWGLPFKHYDIVLPRSADLRLVSRSGRPGRGLDRVRVSKFESKPAEEFRLNALGLRKIYIGATREALSRKVLPGRYEGVYSLTLLSH